MFVAGLFVVALAATVAQAEQFIIKVGANTTANASLIFEPQEVHAKAGDLVTFLFVNGSYDVIQSTFAAPCEPISASTPGSNGFDSGVRPAINGTAQTTLNYTVQDNTTAIWFYENSTCGEGGVGAINANDSSTETLLGFSRNAIRLNGTNATTTSSLPFPSSTSPSSGSSGSNTGSGTSSASPSTTSTSPAERNAVMGTLLALPMAALALLL
jgi:plastocyanin